MEIPSWPRNPVVFEINTWLWLAELSAKYGTFIELGSVPSKEWDALSEYRFDAVWLMGVWGRSPAGMTIANRNPGLRESFRQALPDFHPLDNVGSPYCVRQYVVDELLGGPAGLAAARKELAKRRMRLMLDFVPNHVAPDHVWATRHPEYFIQGSAEDLRNHPADYMQVGRNVIACGRDPNFPAWPDVLQLNAFDPGLRQAAVETLAAIAAQCDGVRCDMAMLVENPIFACTWGSRAGNRPAAEYWAELIPAVRSTRPDFLFMAEAYWGREWELQQQGFDLCYDKRLYDHLEREGPGSIRQHLCADIEYQQRLVRFIENHDEPRAAATFAPAQEKAAAVMIATLPGARLFHEGQFEGRKVKLPVSLARRPVEYINRDLRTFYRTLLNIINEPVFHEGTWSLCEPNGWLGNSSFENLVSWSWATKDQRWLVMVNLSHSPVQARVQLPWNDLRGETWALSDALSCTSYDRDGVELQNAGLYVELEPWGCHLFECYRSCQGMLASAA